MSCEDQDVEQRDDLCFVYLLVHAVLPRFKIGRSANPAQRARSLGQPFDRERSRQFGFYKTQAASTEFFLQERFKHHNVDPAAVGASSGNTEWFDIKCFGQCKLAAHYQAWIVPPQKISSGPWEVIDRAAFLSRGVPVVDGMPLILPPLLTNEAHWRLEALTRERLAFPFALPLNSIPRS